MNPVSERRLLQHGFVQIELTSTLTQEDENRLAPAVLRTLSGVLDMLPIAYIVRVVTTDQNVLEHVNTQTSATDDPNQKADAGHVLEA